MGRMIRKGRGCVARDGRTGRDSEGESGMRVTINGKQEEITDDVTVEGLLAARNIESPNMVSAELNGTMLKRSEFETQKVREGDVVEFLYFMGGGSGE
jgi:sulfur carrier protein